MKRRITIILSVILVITLLTVSIPPVMAKESVTALDENEPVSAESKISDSLKEKTEEADEDEKIPVRIWYQDVDQSSITIEAERNTTEAIRKIYPNYEFTDYLYFILE